MPSKYETIFVLPDSEIPFEGIALGKQFRKVLMKPGTFYHPDTKQQIPASPKWLKELCASTNEWRSKGGYDIAFPDGHTSKGKENLGWWNKFGIMDDGSYFGLVDVPKDEDAVSIGKTIKHVSPAIRFNVEDALGNKYDKVMVHAAATTDPALGFQDNFEEIAASKLDENTLQFSRGDDKVITLKRCVEKGDYDMPKTLEEIGEAISLSKEESTKEKIIETLVALSKKPEEKPKPDVPVVELEKGEEKPTERELQLEKENKALREKNVKDTLDLAVEEGKITPAVHGILKPIMLARKEEVFYLSKGEGGEDKEVKTSVSSLAEKLLKELKANDMVDMTRVSKEGLASSKKESVVKDKELDTQALAMAKTVEAGGGEVIWFTKESPRDGFRAKTGDYSYDYRPGTLEL